NKRGLPIGSPISMAMFNRILYPLDKILFSKSNEKGFSYSRWVDDITISSPLDIGIEYFLGSLDLVDLPIARDKVFFQGSCNIYLLGHKIVSGKFIYKNTKEEKLKNKSPPVNLDEFKNYEAWG
ncbi:hypothetical protein HZB88_02660, partial [archaeon]|nr:hypothetical protein [archaeon]